MASTTKSPKPPNSVEVPAQVLISLRSFESRLEIERRLLDGIRIGMT